jgi:hypothetical protein
MFETHKLNDQGFQQVHMLKTRMTSAVADVLMLMPEGREKALFKTHLEIGMFYGTKAVAGKDGNYTEIVKYDKEGHSMEKPAFQHASDYADEMQGVKK